MKNTDSKKKLYNNSNKKIYHLYGNIKEELLAASNLRLDFISYFKLRYLTSGVLIITIHIQLLTQLILHINAII